MRSQDCHAWLCRLHSAQDTRSQSHPGARTFLSHSEPPVFVSYIDRNGVPDSSTVTLLHDMLAKDWDKTSKAGESSIFLCLFWEVHDILGLYLAWGSPDLTRSGISSPALCLYCCIWFLPFLQMSLSSLRSPMPLDWTAWKCFISQWFPANVYLVMPHYHLENNLHDVHQESSVILSLQEKEAFNILVFSRVWLHLWSKAL